MQHIVGGVFRGQRLIALPSDQAIRPTLCHIRESIFDILVHRFQNTGWLLSGARVADVFAGTGAMGFEALSRGAAHVTFIDHAPAARRVIDANSHALGVAARSTVLVKDALQLPAAVQACTLVFLDSPYKSRNVIPAALSALRATGWLARGALCVVEHLASRTFKPPIGFLLIDTRKYRKIRITFLINL